MPRAVTVLYFAGIREILGVGEARLVLADDVQTVAEFSSYLERTHASLAGHLGSVRFALNESFVTSETRISDGDVIAVIPPVSGG